MKEHSIKHLAGIRKTALLVIFLMASALICLTSRHVALAQSIEGILAGSVTAPDGAVVSGAIVIINNTAASTIRETTTIGEDNYRLDAFEPGGYDVGVTTAGFKTPTQKNISIASGQASTSAPESNTMAQGLPYRLASFTAGQSIGERAQRQTGEPTLLRATPNPPTLDFGDQEVQKLSKQLRLTLTNNTAKPLEIRGVDPDEGDWEDFEPDDDACTGVPLEAGKSCSVGVIFTPRAVGARSSFLLITYDVDPDHPQKISLKGKGIKPKP